MDGIKDAYEVIEPITLRLEEQSVTSYLYRGSLNGSETHLSFLVESFLVEVFRCRVCQFTSVQKARICSHVSKSHSSASPSPRLSCLGQEDEASLAAADEEAELDRSGSPYDLGSGSKNVEDHMDMERMSFLLPMYGMLQNISPPPCDMGLSSTSDGNLHVAQTCEVSTLFEEDRHIVEESVFHLENARDGLHVPLSSKLAHAEEEDTAQSAHLMTLGLCRISSSRCAPPTTPAGVPDPAPDPTPDDKRTLLSASEMQKQSEDELGLSCVFCQAVLPSHVLLEVHLKCHDGEQGFKCPRCGRAESEWADMECHWRKKCRGKKKRSRPHGCSVCSRTFRRADSRDAHEKRHRRVGLRDAPAARCSLCLEWCRSEREWEVHQRCHFQGGFKCLYCNLTEKSWKKLHKHISNQHVQYNGGPDHQTSCNGHSACPGGVRPEPWGCTAKSSSKHKVPGHNESGEDERHDSRRTKNETSGGIKKRKDFCCLLCDKKFSTKLTMRRHMGIHQEEKPFECPHCHYSTRLKASLIQHLRVHTGEKPYKCPQCSYASIDRSSLRRHSRTHTQEKPYSCQYCPYSCIQKKSLDLHSRRHHTGESFPCQLCHYSTPDRQLLLRHVRKHHSTENAGIGADTAPSSKPSRTCK